jgi:hypothetical protein
MVKQEVPPQGISVKKIQLTGVKKSGLFERSEFPDFSREVGFLGNYLQQRRFLVTFLCCSKKVTKPKSSIILLRIHYYILKNLLSSSYSCQSWNR